MSSEIKKEIQLKIAHVLFMDIVGYSERLINEQRGLLDTLNQIVRSTDEFRSAEAAGRLIKIPTGDGMALVFYNSPEAPVESALDASRALKAHPNLRLRMGVHSGPVSGLIDVNARANVAGAGINMAQRVMDCGDAGHILLSKHVAEDLEQYGHWQPHLHDLGECDVKHDVRVHIVNLYTDELGNPAVPEKFRQAKETQTASALPASEAKSAGRSRALIAALVIAAAAAVAGSYIFFHRSSSKALPSSTAPEKSIAVLPFQNLSEDKANAYFADGIQDEILTRLAKIAALKVISRTSTQQYAARPGNLSEIARQLGVANILEGSVQKAADKVHINAQLIRAATDEHLWAESYDRKLENIFGVESEVASAVAEALKAKLTGAEKQTLEQKPTDNAQAYDVYLRGLAYSLRPVYSGADNLDAIKYFGEAVKLDPKFTLAWAWLARESALGYFNEIDNDVHSLRETAKHAADKAIESEPNLAEAHLAQGYFHYYCERDFDSAIASFEKAGQLSPNNSQVYESLGLVWRRKGGWQRSLEYLCRASQLDPRDIRLLLWQVEAFHALRQYSTALTVCDQILDISRDNGDALEWKATIFQAQGNLPGSAAMLLRLRSDSTSEPFIIGLQFNQWKYERRYSDAITALRDSIARRDRPLSAFMKMSFTSELALLQQFSGNTAAARSTWQQVQTEAEKLRINNDVDLAGLASAYVGLGDKAKAFAIMKENRALLSALHDAMTAAWFPGNMAWIAAQAGEKELALEQLAISAQNPDGVNYGDVKLDPKWDSLRGDPRFEKIVASLAPKAADK